MGARALRARGRSAVLWGLACLLAAPLGLTWVQNRFHPEWRDPEFADRQLRLEAVRAANPGRPLVVVLGTSRVTQGLRPDRVRDAAGPGDGSPVVFNFAIPGNGPLRNLMNLRRLLAAGVRPDYVLIEYWPPFYSGLLGEAEIRNVDPATLGWRDVPTLKRVGHPRGGLPYRWALARLGAWFTNRVPMLTAVMPHWLPPELEQYFRLSRQKLDPLGWLPGAEGLADWYKRRLVEENRVRFTPVIRPFQLAAVSDRALRESVGACRAAGVPVALLWMPDAPEFYTWWAPGSRAEAASYFRRLGRECGVPLVDASGWLSDDDFADATHMFVRGANAFSERFGRDVLPRLLRHQPPEPTDRADTPALARR